MSKFRTSGSDMAAAAAGEKNQNFMEWFIQFRSPQDILKHHATFMWLEITTFICFALTLIHALKVGGRYRFLWLGLVLHGLAVEGISYALPDVDSFWHAQGLVMFLGQRLPLYIVCIYSVFLYTASVAVAHSGMKKWAQPFAVGVSVVILDIPYDILGIKNLFWTWHDTDPNIYDRSYSVPLTSYYFHATFASGFTFVFHGLHKLLAPSKDTFQYAGFFRECVCCLVASMTGFPLGVLQFVLIYHPLHDTYKIHTENCVVMLFVVYGLLIWMGDRSSDKRVLSKEKRSWFSILMLEVVIFYSYFVYLVFTSKPENNVVTGLHEPVGPCNETEPVLTPFGVLSKKKYLCLNNYDEAVFDFHCTKRPAAFERWYTICGTPYENHIEYIMAICTAVGLGLMWYYNLLHRSCGLPGFEKRVEKSRKMKQN